jgi:putative ABC transport system permease protein
MRGVTMQYGSASHDAQLLIGTTPAFLDIDETEIAVGAPFTDADYTTHARKILIGTTVANNLGNRDPNQLIGEEVRINGQGFTVVGIMGPKGYSGQRDLDDRVIAVGTAVNDALYGYSPQSLGPINGIAIKARTPELVSAVQLQATQLLAARHGVSLLNADFIVFNASSILDASADSNKTLSILLAVVAGISLLVGGIGVMNIMLVSVTERTREIGIRKAIGAGRRDIVGQFLGEAVFLSLAGGVLGVAAGFVAVQWQIAGVDPVIAPYSIYLSLGVSLLTGLVFGLYPASRAADLRPIDALRYE